MMKKVILVTGASSGIGKTTALHLIKEGHVVYGVARRINKMQDIVSAGGKTLEMDVTNHDQVRSVIEEIIDREGKIDVLINNAGYAVYGPVEEISYEQAKRQFEVNLFGLAEVTKAVLPKMRGHRSGKIINISSVGGKVYTPLGAWYHATKHALEGWSDCLRLELKDFGIDVVIVEPGIIRTEFLEAMDNPYGDAEGSPYKTLINSMEKASANGYKPENSSPSSDVSKVIAKIVKAKKPKTRYTAGKRARQSLLGRKFLSDRMFDRMITGMVNKLSK